MKPQNLESFRVQFKKHKADIRKEFYAFLAFARKNFPEKMEGRTGCYVNIPLEINETLSYFTLNLGVVSKEKREKYSFLSKEKPKRLFETSRSSSTIRTSFQTRNTEAILSIGKHRKESWGQWGGAICLYDEIISCSGFPEVIDECFCLWLAKRYYGCSNKELTIIFKLRKPIELWEPEILETFKFLKIAA